MYNAMMDTEFFISRLQCTREGKQDLLYTVRQLVELAFAARDQGLLSMEGLIDDHARFPDAFLRKAVQIVIEISNPDNIRRVLYNVIYTTAAYKSNHKFLEGVIIIETVIAISQKEDLDYIFTYLLPSYFGMEYEESVIDVYRNFKKGLVHDAALEMENNV